ncbi:hypothetical protein TNCV_1350201 [Trichonephila clavipes]|nr:hypothetical protein TNCV_1350201 [Trichonephila clavipes]
MSSPGFEPSPYGIAVSVTNHYTDWATVFTFVHTRGMPNSPSQMIPDRLIGDKYGDRAVQGRVVTVRRQSCDTLIVQDR